MSRASSLVLLGLWLGLLAFSWVMAGASFRTAEASSAGGETAARLGAVPEAERRMVFRSLAADWNRSMFRARSAAEVVLGLALLALVFRRGGAAVPLSALALGLALLQGVWLGPAMEAFSRPLDFVPRPLPGEAARHFGLLHGAYLFIDLGKAVLAVVLAWLLVRPA
jgi:hypothetical protein